MSNIKPLGDRVLVAPKDPKDEMLSKSGIIIPDSADKEKPHQGTVLAVGSGKYDDGVLIPMTVKVGDNVIFSKYSPDEIKVDDKEYYLISESNILAVIE